MTTQQLMDNFYQNHKQLADYVNSLPDEQFLHTANNKWTPGQQLAHVYLTLVPISQALGSKEYIQNKFGIIDRATMSYEHVIETYKNGLAAGGKAPEQYLPQDIPVAQREEYTGKLLTILDAIRQQIATYTDEELDTLVLPHPFLGKLTLRELFYLMSYHPIHHLEKTKENLGA
jgi:hypothetical protein